MSNEDAPDLDELLSDQYCWAILAAASAQPVTAKDVVEEFDLATTTVYRRINQLMTYDLLEEHTRIDSQGNQYNVYSATFQFINIQISNGTACANIVRDQAHSFERMYQFELPK